MTPTHRFQLHQDSEQIQGLGRRVHRRQNLRTQMILDGSDERGRLVRRAQDGIHKVTGGRLAVSAGDSGQRDPLIWLPIKISRCYSQRVAAMFHLYPAAGKFRRTRRIAYYSDRAADNHIRCEPPSVGVLSLKKKK
jgi:hypothetical protein